MYAADGDLAILQRLAQHLQCVAGKLRQLIQKQDPVVGQRDLPRPGYRAAAGQGHRRAALALDVFCYGVRKMIAGYAAAMGGVDTVVFTAGVGENSADTRARILRGLEFMGITCDPEKNNCRGKEQIISQDGAPVTVMVVPTNEELMIAQDTMELVLDQE